MKLASHVLLRLLLVPALLLVTSGCAAVTSVGISERAWGAVDGTPVRLFTLENGRGWTLQVCEYGAIIVALRVPDRDGVLADVTLGHDDLEGYRAGRSYFGGIAGRCANRIAGARFELDGVAHTLAANDGAHALHGGGRGFDRHVWAGEAVVRADGPAVALTLRSPAGDEGYPGTLDARVVYVLTHDGSLRVEMSATTDAPTLCNLVQHTYWNLAGHDAGPVLDHVLTSPAVAWLPVDDTLIPTGEVAPVDGTPFDFRAGKSLGRDLAAVGGTPVGYDHNLVLPGDPGTLRWVASVSDPASGRRLRLFSDQPGVQLYTGNFLDAGEVGKGGAAYGQYGGFCLETQLWPDAVHHPTWASPVLRPGETYRHVMVGRFDVVDDD